MDKGFVTKKSKIENTKDDLDCDDEEKQLVCPKFDLNNHWPFSSIRDAAIAKEYPGSDLVEFNIFPKKTKPILGNYKLRSKFEESTSQGQIYFLKDSKTDHTMVVKISELRSLEKSPWVLSGKKEQIMYIQRECIEAYCYGLLSKYSFDGTWPHFVRIYDCFLGKIQEWKLEEIPAPKKIDKRKRILLMEKEEEQRQPSEKLVKQGKEFAGQIICMEKIRKDLLSVLKTEFKSQVWWSSICQFLLTLIFLQKRHGFIHNDSHPDNIRVRKVAKDSFLYYKIGENLYLKVPTFGYLITLIDFGRSSIVKDGQRYVSSEYSNGACKGQEPLSTSFDLVRFVVTLEAKLTVIHDFDERDELRKWFREVTKNDVVEDLFSKKTLKDPMFVQVIAQDLFSKKCKNGVPENHLPLFIKRYHIEKNNIPENETIYSIS